jgi:hypothetical protein
VYFLSVEAPDFNPGEHAFRRAQKSASTRRASAPALRPVAQPFPPARRRRGCAPTITIAATGKSDNGATALTRTPVAEVYPEVRGEPACRPQVPAPVRIADSDSHRKGPAFRPFRGLRSGGLQAGVPVAASLPRHLIIANPTAAPLKTHKGAPPVPNCTPAESAPDNSPLVSRAGSGAHPPSSARTPAR